MSITITARRAITVAATGVLLTLPGVALVTSAAAQYDLSEQELVDCRFHAAGEVGANTVGYQAGNFCTSSIG